MKTETHSRLPLWYVDAERNFSGLAEFVTRWTNYLVTASVISEAKQAEILESMSYDSAVGLWATASFATNSKHSMPDWVEPIFSSIAEETPWLFQDEYEEFIESQEEVKKALATIT